ncbi:MULTISPECIES: hypothetical protein [Qipengyuania]|uniref:Uncharacterized protein n=1 Tax=Qipengyuania gelatinilytica TaxID=2867231 RepID=A0ABX9A092_9SPHN|nr:MULTISPECIES: hypothetical protein [Qipengyuania]MBX7533590.1 hypothetical protein [Qipengyuania xiamenensis]QZD94554.1 hypothetical protein K3136_10675 [Qipengyuania gelatinilytica]
MSKQLTLSATVAVLSMAAFALSTSIGGNEKAEHGVHAASAPQVVENAAG